MYSKETPNYKLPQWVPKDHPDFLTDLNEAFMKLDKNMFDNYNDYETIRDLVEKISTNMISINEEFAEIKEKVDALINLEDNPAFIEVKEAIVAIMRAADELEGRVSKNENDIAALQSTMSAVVSSTNSLRTDVDALNNSFAAMHTAVDGLTTNIANITNLIHDITNRVTDLETSQTAQDLAIADLQKADRDMQTLIDGLQTGSGLTDTEIVNIKTRLDNTEKETNDNRQSIVENAANITTNTQDIVNLGTRVGSNETNIINAKNEINTLDGRLEGAENWIDMFYLQSRLKYRGTCTADIVLDSAAYFGATWPELGGNIASLWKGKANFVRLGPLILIALHSMTALTSHVPNTPGDTEHYRVARGWQGYGHFENFVYSNDWVAEENENIHTALNVEFFQRESTLHYAELTTYPHPGFTLYFNRNAEYAANYHNTIESLYFDIKCSYMAENIIPPSSTFRLIGYTLFMYETYPKDNEVLSISEDMKDFKMEGSVVEAFKLDPNGFDDFMNNTIMKTGGMNNE